MKTLIERQVGVRWHVWVSHAVLGVTLSLSCATAAFAAVETYEPTLSALVAPQAAQLQAAGVKSILARTGKNRRDIQVQTQWGPAYFRWPKNVAPALFEIYIANNGTAEVYTENYSEATKSRYAAAFNAVIRRRFVRRSSRALRHRSLDTNARRVPPAARDLRNIRC